MHKDAYDLIVIGSGPAGQRAAIQAAKLGKKVLIVEKSAIGGSSLHYGTIPSKTMREAAILSSLKKHYSLQWVLQRTKQVIEAEAQVMKDQLARNKVEFVHGLARFQNKNEIVIQHLPSEKNTVAFGEKIIIAVGSKPSHPKNFPFHAPIVFDSDTILNIPSLPKSLLVIGAGVIGCEYASIFAKLGVKVTLMDRRKELLRCVDAEVVECLKAQFQQNNINLILGGDLGTVQVIRSRIGPAKVEAFLNKEREHFSAALICMGREGNTQDLGAENISININPRGIIETNEYYQTNVPNIYAVGDVIGAPALAASSAEQGRLAACHAFGLNGGTFPASFPYGIYTIPEVSSVGLQESELIEKNVPYVVGRARYSELARGQILGDDTGFLKLLFHKETKKILGIHIIGSGATELIHIGQIVYTFGGDLNFFIDNVFNYPTLAEAYKVAAYNANNKF